MNNNEINDFNETSKETNNKNARPVKKLVRTDKIRSGNASVAPQQEYHGRYEAQEPVQEEYRGRYEAQEPSQEEYHGRYEAEEPSQQEYHGRYEAQGSVQEDNSDTDYNSDGYSEEYDEDNAYEAESKEKSSSAKDIIVKIASIVLSFALIIVLILNMPIIAYSKTGKPIENVSIITFLKRWQPLVQKEGELEQTTMPLNVDSEIVHEEFTDGLDLPQNIEGQYSVLFLGFDEEESNTDVCWVFQFDIAAAKINVLQIPRDTFVPSYTSAYTGKFNSVYAFGDQSVTPIQRVVNAVQDNFGIPIDAYVTTACFDIVDMVDLVGGIPVNLESQITYEPGKIIPAGKSTLTGQQAEWFVRYRHGFSEGDIGRVKNQRIFLAAAMEKLLNIYEEDGKMKFYGYLKEIYENEYILTDMSLENISMLADFASTVSMENVQVNMVPGEGADYYPPGHTQAQSVWSVHKQATIDMLNQYYRPYQHDMILEESALAELITDYLTTHNDNTSNTLEEIQGGE